MAIIRRNPDGTIASQEGFESQQQVSQPTQSHPALANRRGMAAMAEAGRAIPPLMLSLIHI